MHPRHSATYACNGCAREEDREYQRKLPACMWPMWSFETDGVDVTRVKSPRLDGCETSAQTHQGREHEQAMPTRSADSASMVRASERSDRRLDTGMPCTKQLWACPLSYGECDHRSNWCRGIVIQTTRVAKGRDDQERHTGRTPPRSWTGYGRAPCQIA